MLICQTFNMLYVNVSWNTSVFYQLRIILKCVSQLLEIMVVKNLHGNSFFRIFSSFELMFTCLYVKRITFISLAYCQINLDLIQ